MTSTFIAKGQPCHVCGIAIVDETGKPTVLDTAIGGQEMQIIVHWDCLDPQTQAEIKFNQARMNARIN